MASSIPHLHIRARFDGKVFVPEEPLTLPEGTILDGWAVPATESWPPGFIERTMGAWTGDDIAECPDPVLRAEEPFAD